MVPLQIAGLLIVFVSADASASRRRPEGLGPLHRHEFMLGLAMYTFLVVFPSFRMLIRYHYPVHQMQSTMRRSPFIRQKLIHTSHRVTRLRHQQSSHALRQYAESLQPPIP